MSLFSVLLSFFLSRHSLVQEFSELKKICVDFSSEKKLCGNYAENTRICGKCDDTELFGGKCGPHNFPEPRKKYAVVLCQKWKNMRKLCGNMIPPLIDGAPHPD